MISVLNTNDRKKVATEGGLVGTILAKQHKVDHVLADIREMASGESFSLHTNNQSNLFYIMTGEGGQFYHRCTKYDAKAGTGVYLEPGENLLIGALKGPLTILHIVARKHAAKPLGPRHNGRAHGYYFDESKLAVVEDEEGLRTQTYWVNRDMDGQPASWDICAGKVRFKAGASSPRQIHRGTATNPTGAAHFCIIQEGICTAMQDTHSQRVSPGGLIIIPPDEWYRLAADEGSELVYYEIWSPNDCAREMNHDPLGSDLYIRTPDDSAGKRTLWTPS